jgi:hypothetical protein
MALELYEIRCVSKTRSESSLRKCKPALLACSPLRNAQGYAAKFLRPSEHKRIIYTHLDAQLSLTDKATLVTLLPDVFRWAEAEAYNNSISTVPERTLVAQLPKEVSDGTDYLRE